MRLNRKVTAQGPVGHEGVSVWRLFSITGRTPNTKSARHQIANVCELPRVGRRVEDINSSTELRRVMALKYEGVQLRADDLRDGTHPLGWMPKSPQSHGKLWRSPKSPSLRSCRFAQDAGHAMERTPLRAVVFSLVHDPITVAHELLDRIRIKECGRNAASRTLAENERLTKGAALCPVKGLLVMQSGAYRGYPPRVFSNGLWLASRNDVIPADVRLRSKCFASPAVDEAKDGEAQWSTHQTTPPHGDLNTAVNNPQATMLHPRASLFGEVANRVAYRMHRPPDSETLGSQVTEELGKTSPPKTADHGLNSVMREAICRFCQVGTKPTLTGPEPEIVAGATLHRGHEVLQARVLATQRGEDAAPHSVSGRKDGSRWYGNDPCLRALLRDRCRPVDEHRAPDVIVNTMPKVLHRQQCTQTLQDFWRVTCVNKRRRSEYAEQAVIGCRFSGRAVSCQLLLDGKEAIPCVLIHLFPDSLPSDRRTVFWEIQYRRGGNVKNCFAEPGIDQRPQPGVVAALGPAATLNRVLARRKDYEVLLSQSIPEPCSYILLQTLQRLRVCMCRFGNIYHVGRVRAIDGRFRRLRESPCHPGEGQDFPGLGSRFASEPSLHAPGHLVHVTDLPLRERKITKGHGEVLQLRRRPVSPAGSRPGYPGPESPAARMLRKTSGHETSPDSLPHSCLGIDNTPMGLALRTSFRGARAGTYYTAKKK
ncbi:MAG: hypothetical protein FNaV1_gp2 [Fushun narnavirus 1]|nr:MAG: hypothetical protein FNaV1_gp2 [Fushun narnavirus 1]